MKTAAHWKKIGQRPHHGILAPLFSIRTQNSSGIGEFLDLLPLIDWCVSIGLDVIQLLPINDSGEDLSPYYAVSSCALDPVYLSLFALPGAQNLSDFKSLSSTHRVERLEVRKKKLEWLYAYFQTHFQPKDPTYIAFLKHHQSWLPAYTEFKTKKDPTLPAEFHSYLQFLCFSQMKTAREHASNQGVFLKGDIPILFNPDSADVLAEKHLFDLTLSAGAPPDQYNALGQNWGFPLFRWDALRFERYAWWKRRLQVASELFHLYRIDHVVGYFRIWAIPQGKNPMEGHFVPPDPNLWMNQGREILQMMIDASPLLPIAEDLGTIPKGVTDVLKELGICSTKVFLWQKRGSPPKTIPLSQYEPLSLTTVSTPDSDPLAVMWEKYPDLSHPYTEFKRWPSGQPLTSAQRKELLRDAHHTSSLFHINLLQETLALFPELVNPNPEEERINVPGTLLPTNWTYRFRPSIEEMRAHVGLKAAFREILSH
ncbi:MAG TPA: 4-alpha-glucanotransferase [Chlamydiales bacterium]